MQQPSRLTLLSHITPRFCAVFAISISIAIVLGCSVGHVSRDAADESAQTACVDPRPQICTRDYRPVCGNFRDGSTNTYGNACDACSHPKVVGHRPGEC